MQFVAAKKNSDVRDSALCHCSSVLVPTSLAVAGIIGLVGFAVCTFHNKKPADAPFKLSLPAQLLSYYVASAHVLFLLIGQPGTGGILKELSGELDAQSASAWVWWACFQIHKTADVGHHILGFRTIHFPWRIDHLAALLLHLYRYLLLPLTGFDLEVPVPLLPGRTFGDFVDGGAHAATALYFGGVLAFVLAMLVCTFTRLLLLWIWTSVDSSCRGSNSDASNVPVAAVEKEMPYDAGTVTASLVLTTAAEFLQVHAF
uniref:Uncharacterized protein n=1 Tax=Chromera velia CCMP2878 TaxID=1169474 RepID=A0A0G4IAJ5_9ALVE|eukprot:Cvel_12557.t1-p1 / transcript=Cvel_12557.t1 / gene=Cvel_12557 / organism=Chromera_velia_CCMP2878 / gene_product=hypothetical protein / transcript_product=hypothetical protein / location=Cvel_scaffold825:62824-63597(-) / protein_length=258 / sequence_SO=supercontig / SO=protein_coding / is_pseudo=false